VEDEMKRVGYGWMSSGRVEDEKKANGR